MEHGCFSDWGAIPSASGVLQGTKLGPWPFSNLTDGDAFDMWGNVDDSTVSEAITKTLEI